MSVYPIKKPNSADINQLKLNPLLGGITFASTEDEMLKLVARDPFRLPSWRQDNHDIDLIRSYMQQVVIPTRTILRGGVAIHRALKTSLYQQNPNLADNQRQYFSEASSLASINPVRGVHEGVVFQGITGVGKSHLLHACLSTIPQHIERSNICGVRRVVQINWIYLDLTSVASVEALAHRIVETIDTLLNCNGALFELSFKGIRSAQAKIETAIRILKTHFCGLIVIDEIQFENFATPAAATMRSWILRIANVGIGLIFSGNPLGFKLKLPANDKNKDQYPTQVLRRLFSSNNTRLDPALSANDADWVIFTRGINRCRLYGEPHPYDSKLELLKFELTGGFQDFYVELHCSIEKILVQHPKKVVNEELIKLAAQKSSKLKEMEPLISAFAHKDSMALRLCSDVDHDYYQRLWGQGCDVANNNEESGPVGIVSTAPTNADPTKSLAEDKKAATRRRERKERRQNHETNPSAAAIRDHLLDGLQSVISGKTKDEAEEQ